MGGNAELRRQRENTQHSPEFARPTVRPPGRRGKPKNGLRRSVELPFPPTLVNAGFSTPIAQCSPLTSLEPLLPANSTRDRIRPHNFPLAPSSPPLLPHPIPLSASFLNRRSPHCCSPLGTAYVRPHCQSRVENLNANAHVQATLPKPPTCRSQCQVPALCTACNLVTRSVRPSKLSRSWKHEHEDRYKRPPFCEVGYSCNARDNATIHNIARRSRARPSDRPAIEENRKTVCAVRSGCPSSKLW